MTWIQTYSHRRFDLLNPRIEDVHIEDIAHALSHLCRFNGHTLAFYSVAQHSVLVAQICEEREPGTGLAGLMHDAAEAYIGDVTRPLKQLLSAEFDLLVQIEARVAQVIAQAFGMSWPFPAIVHQADEILLATEVRDLLPGGPRDPENWICRWPAPHPMRIEAWSPWLAKSRFLRAFDVYMDASRSRSIEQLTAAAEAQSLIP